MFQDIGIGWTILLSISIIIIFICVFLVLRKLLSLISGRRPEPDFRQRLDQMPANYPLRSPRPGGSPGVGLPAGEATAYPQRARAWSRDEGARRPQEGPGVWATAAAPGGEMPVPDPAQLKDGPPSRDRSRQEEIFHRVSTELTQIMAAIEQLKQNLASHQEKMGQEIQELSHKTLEPKLQEFHSRLENFSREVDQRFASLESRLAELKDPATPIPE
jgi:hypothetical protein